MSQRTLCYAPIAALVPADVNPKLHDIPSLIASMERFGFVNPAVVDERTGKLAAGHGRREALISMKLNGDPPPEGVFLDEDGDWLLPVVRGWFSRTDLEVEAFIIADNQLTIAGGWHHKTLVQMLEGIVTEDAPLLDALGFTADGLDDLLRRIDPDKILPKEGGDEWDDSSGSTLLDQGDDQMPEKPDPKARMHQCPACGFESKVN